MARFRLPDLTLPFPAPRRRPDADLLRVELCDWGVRHALIGPRGRDRLLGSKLLDWGLDMVVDAPRERAMVLLGWYLWVLTLDDRVDNGTWALEGNLPAFAADALAATSGSVPESDPMLRMLALDLWPRTAALAGPAWRARFGASFRAYLAAQHVVVDHRTGRRELTLADYLRLRRDLVGIELFLDLLAVLDGPDRPDPDPGSTARLRSATADVVSWTNDLFSVEKDLAFGEPANLVLLTQREQGLSWQQAVDAVHRRWQERLTDLLALLGEDPGGYPRRLRTVVRAALDWHQGNSRYHLQATGTDRAIRTERTPPSLLWPEFDRDPYPLYRRLREEFPVVRDEPLDAWLLSRYAEVRTALTDPRFTSRGYEWQLAPLLGRTLLQMDGREHTAHRALLTPAFRGRALAELRGVAEEAAHALVAGLRGRPRLDLVAEFCQWLPVTVVAAVLGLPREDVPDLRRWYRSGISYVGNYRQDPQVLRQGARDRDELFAYLQPHLARCRRAPGQDLFSLLCTTPVAGGLMPDDMVKGFCGMLLAAGSDTTEKGLTSFLANLLDHPEQLRQVRDDPGLLPQAWAESLRRDTPTQLMLRQTATEVVIGGHPVAAGATVACLLGSANRDPARFADPDRFDIHRADGHTEGEFTAAATHLAFGAGRHFCLGAQLSRLEAEVGVSALLTAFPDLRWSAGAVRPESGQFTRGLETLLVETGSRTGDLDLLPG